jgi:hypothetical protein
MWQDGMHLPLQALHGALYRTAFLAELCIVLYIQFEKT